MFKLMNEFRPIVPEQTSRFLAALADPSRLEIVYLLAERGEMNVGEIAGRFPLSRPAISHHLKVLRDAGVLEREKRGQEVYYRVAFRSVAARLRGLAEEVEACAAS
jgi:ArsR family transcriptional regulator, arsenate/arsenite/antimonite-responsive transcriptional repressor